MNPHNNAGGGVIYFSKLLFLLLLFVSLINFLIELYFNVKKMKGDEVQQIIERVHLPRSYDSNFILQHAKDSSIDVSQLDYNYALGYSRDYSEAKTFKGTADGRRVTPAKYLNGKKYQGVLFGASQSWGYFTPEEYILPNVLSDKLDSVGIDNYSIQGVTLEQQLLYWQLNKKYLSNKDFVLVVGGTFDVAKYCVIDKKQFVANFTKNPSETNFGIKYLIELARVKLAKHNEIDYCSREEDVEIVLHRIINDLNLLLIEAESQKKRILIIFPPTPYFGGVSTGNIESDPAFLNLKNSLNPLYKKLDERLNSFEDHRILNFMHSFNDNHEYFIDKEGHLNADGHKKLAEDIIKRVDVLFFTSK